MHEPQVQRVRLRHHDVGADPEGVLLVMLRRRERDGQVALVVALVLLVVGIDRIDMSVLDFITSMVSAALYQIEVSGRIARVSKELVLLVVGITLEDGDVVSLVPADTQILVGIDSRLRVDGFLRHGMIPMLALTLKLLLFLHRAGCNEEHCTEQ